MRSNWTTSTERFKNLQTQARVTRGEHGELTKEVAELKAKLESAATGSPETTSNVRSFSLFRVALLTCFLGCFSNRTQS